MCLWVHVCLCVCVHACVDVCTSDCVEMCQCVHTCVCVCRCVQVPVSVWVPLGTHVSPWAQGQVNGAWLALKQLPVLKAPWPGGPWSGQLTWASAEGCGGQSWPLAALMFICCLREEREEEPFCPKQFCMRAVTI